jgi:capsular exopolysaccharide synthesis family protein
VELLTYWRIIRKRLWFIILLVLLAGSGAVYYTSQQPPIYRTFTTLFINPGQVSPMLPGGAEGFAFSGSNSLKSLVNTYSALMSTRSFVEQVVQEMETPVSEDEVSDALSSQYVEGTQFFRILATHEDPQIAQELADTAARVLIAKEVQRQRSQQEQIDDQFNQAPSAENQQIAELIQSLRAELAYYNDRIQETETELIQIEDARQAGEEVNNERLEELIELLPNLRYARIDVQTRLADAEIRRSSLNETNTQPVDTAVVVDAAALPVTPISQNSLQLIVVSVLLALTLGVGLAFVLEYLDYTLKSPEELEHAYAMPVQGVIGMINKKNVRQRHNSLIMITDSSPVAESFRALRTGIQVEGLNRSLRSILVTSAGPGEGKTFVAANLAASLALSGARVILIDTDLRKPRMHQIFNLQRGVGFTNLVVNQEHQLTDALQSTSIRNLQVLTAGAIPPNPAELLNSSRAINLMQQIQGHADIVIYDSPPAATVTDGAIIAQRVDGVIQVIWAGHTRTNLVLRCKAILEQVGAHMIGPVLNQVRVADLGYYYYYYYYGYYNENGQKSSTSWWKKVVPRRKRARVRSLQDVDINAITNTNGSVVGVADDPESKNGDGQHHNHKPAE